MYFPILTKYLVEDINGPLRIVDSKDQAEEYVMVERIEGENKYLPSCRPINIMQATKIQKQIDVRKGRKLTLECEVLEGR